MSFIYRDFLTPARFEWNRASSLYHKFNKVWGKSTIDGIQVYDNKLIYWNNTLKADIPFKRFINALGIEYAALESTNYEGIDYAYFTLNPSKYKYTAPSLSEITAQLNNTFNINDEFELKITYDGRSKRIVESHWKLITGLDPTKISSYIIDTEGIVNTLHSDPLKYFANISLESAGQPLNIINPKPSPRNTPVTTISYNSTNDIYTTLALLDNNSTFQQQGTIYNEQSQVEQSSDGNVYFIYSYNIKFKVISNIIDTSYITTCTKTVADTLQVASEYVHRKRNTFNTTVNLEEPSVHTLYSSTNVISDTAIKQAVVSMSPNEIDSLTYSGHLIVDNVALMKRKDFAKMLALIFGSDIEQEDAKWYEIIVAVILVVIAVIIAIHSFGAAGGISNALVAAAAGLAAGSAALSVGLVVYASAFPTAMDMIKIIGKFAQVIGVLAMITGVMAAIQTAFNKAAQTALANKTISDVSQYTTTQFIKDILIKAYESVKTSVMNKIAYIIDPSKWSITDISSITLNDVSGWLSNIGDGFKLYNKFFGHSKQYNTLTEEAQATKEEGVESIYLANEMLYNNDVLQKIDTIIKNNNGGQKTENFLIQIY